jgi:hypothetical protein
MMQKIFWIIAAFYIFLTMFLFLQNATKHGLEFRFFYPHQATILQIEAGQSENTSSAEREFAKLFYNKPLGYMQSYIDNIYRSVDIPFLFTLTNGSSMYEDQGPTQMLFPWELLLFIPGVIFLIRSKNKIKIWMLYYFLVVIFLAAFFLPSLNQLKLLPEVLGIRLVIIFGLYEGVKKWLKK